MRTANLLSISSLKTPEILSQYLSYLNTELKKHELDGIKALCGVLANSNASSLAFCDWCLGYHIPQISKEFDLLRIGAQSIINIEIKSEYNEGKIKKQLIQNAHYLSFLDRPTSLFAFISDCEKVYELRDGVVTEIHPAVFSKVLSEQGEIFDGNVDVLFKPANYLVSPFNTPEKFLEGSYFLTGQQERIIKSISKCFLGGSLSVSIAGRAGTGKTLLLYHLAKCYLEQGKKVLIVHGGMLNNGQNALNESPGWSIVSIKQAKNHLCTTNWDTIIIDETQRIIPTQITQIVEHSRQENIHLIFGLDPEQTLKTGEGRSVEIVESTCSDAASFVLTEKIRTNKELARFIRGVFEANLSIDSNVEKVSVFHFDNAEEALHFIDTHDDYCYLAPTPSMYNHHWIETLNVSSRLTGNSHEVLGQEFDNVIIVLDSGFFYGDNGHLFHRGNYKTNYLAVKMLFQNITRVREKLLIVVIDNIPVFSRILRLCTLAPPASYD